MWIKVLRLIGKIPPEVKSLLLLLMEALANLWKKGRTPEKKDIEKTIIRSIEGTRMPIEHKLFVMTLTKYYYNDGKISPNEAINLVLLLLNIHGIGIDVDSQDKYMEIKIWK